MARATKKTAKEEQVETPAPETEPTTVLDAKAPELTEALEQAAEAGAQAAVATEALTNIVARPAYPADEYPDADGPFVDYNIRDERGLVKGVEYHFLPDGKVDWRKMIDPKYIVLRKENKKDIEEATGKKFEEVSVDEVDDKYLLLLLGGIKDLLKLRGFHTVKYPNKVAMPGFVSTDCEIQFIGNFETSFNAETFTDGADATPDNVEGWYAQYLTTAANNRALVRAVRNYLGIYIVGKDEVGPRSEAETISNSTTKTGVDGFGPYAMLADLLKKRDRTFAQLKKYLKSEPEGVKFEGIDEWEKIEDVPKEQVFKIVGLVKKIASS